MPAWRTRIAAVCIFAAAIEVSGERAPKPELPEFKSVRIVTSDHASVYVKRYAVILADELTRNTVSLDVTGGTEPALEVRLFCAEDEPDAAGIYDEYKIRPLTPLDPGPEGFALRFQSADSGRVAVIIGIDTRGVLYGVGELLRRLEYDERSVRPASGREIRTAPAFEVRGTEVSQGHTITELTGSRKWTAEEWQRAVTGYALAGANTFGVGHVTSPDESRYAFIRSLGLKTLSSLSPNQGSGPPEWAAVEAIGRGGYLCPSVPEARAAIIKSVRDRWSGSEPVDYVRMYSGDGGGCECDRCAPYGGTYIEMCEILAGIIHEYHPGTQIFATNQKLDNAGDLAMYKHLRENGGGWLGAVCIGPGSNAMSWMPGRRQDHRMDLFRYPGFGPMGRYFLEMVKELPPETDLVFFNDLTHWVYSQNGLMDHQIIPDRDHQEPPLRGHEIYDARVDPAYLKVYDRRTFHARPRALHEVFRETMGYGIGDVTYSEGHHDHFNQWMWQRLMWNPRLSSEEVTRAYAERFFGSDVAARFAAAIGLHEENLSRPVGGNEHPRALLEQFEAAYAAMPSWRRERNYTAMQFLQRAALDLHIQLQHSEQWNTRLEIERAMRETATAADLTPAIRAALERAKPGDPTPEMIRLKERARELGEWSGELYGLRSEGYFSLEQDFVGFGWMRRQLETALATPPDLRTEAVRLIHAYEDAGEGGFYDDAGNPDKSPRMTYGWSFGDGIFDPTDRESQRTAAFTTDETRGVTFEYDGLDPGAAYRVRMTLVRPKYLPRFGKFQHQTSQSIFADGHALARDLELPEFTSKFFEFDIPREATADGRLTLWLEKQPGVGEGPRPDVTVWRNTGGWGTLVSEVWLMRADHD